MKDPVLIKDAIERAEAYRIDCTDLMEEYKEQGLTEELEFAMLSQSYALVGNLVMHLRELCAELLE